MSLYLKIEYKQIVVHIKRIATAKFLRESALPTENTLKPTKQALKFANLEVVGRETKQKKSASDIQNFARNQELQLCHVVQLIVRSASSQESFITPKYDTAHHFEK